MTSFKLLLLVGTALATSSGAALAQTSPTQQTPRPAPATAPTASPQTPAPAPAATSQTPPATEAAPPAEDEEEATALSDVVVTTRPADVRTSIDSTSYSLANDLQATTGTLADALRNVPSVEVDPDGNVSLRGDANVTILVDGRPSTQFNGPSRGQMIQQIPADQYARVEVMTNPSAAYSPEGSGGVINLITKPTTVKPAVTTTGSIRANIGDAGRYNLGANIAHVNGKLTLSADVGLRHDGFVAEVERVRDTLDTGSGQFLQSRTTQQNDGNSDSLYVRLAAEYNLDTNTQLVAELRHTDVDSDVDAVTLYEADAWGGGVASAYRRATSGGFEGQFSGATARVVRRFGEQGHDWTNEIRFDRNEFTFGGDTFADQLIPAATPFFETVNNQNSQDQLGITSAMCVPSRTVLACASAMSFRRPSWSWTTPSRVALTRRP